MKRIWISCLIAYGMMFTDTPDQHASQQKEATVTQLQQQVRQLHAQLADRDEKIRELQARVQAYQEQLTRLKERYEQITEPIQKQRLKIYHQELQARQAAEQRAAEVRRQTARARSERIRRNMDPMGYWLHENPVPYYFSPTYRLYGYRYPYAW
ncbi:MAG: hypothetical protein JXA82_13510 [Sedimentisphaerales bacterium]|nr:hypothetical protein [Sedimentisphaerales bacterium]